MAGSKKSATRKKNGKYTKQYTRTIERTGKWRGKKV